jgi:hypothetical protein
MFQGIVCRIPGNVYSWSFTIESGRLARLMEVEVFYWRSGIFYKQVLYRIQENNFNVFR